MTTAEAARQWVEAKKAIDEATPLKDEAALVLKEHFRKADRHTYRSKTTGETIVYSTQSRTVLDTTRVKAHLGDMVKRFQKSQTVEQLSLLK